ncbi:hypothetical protein [Streptomyces jumonjinensis]|uniref:hypothetical protein n=1 Tax=Streptomyces jumonjinensis TaxID=1945 RepID=UPI003792B70C
MAKQSGLGDNFYLSGNNLSGDVGSLGNVGGGGTPLPQTGIDKSAYERVGGLLSGGVSWSSWWNPTRAHPVLSALPRTDAIASYLRGTALGSPAACVVGKQVNYDGNRGDDGAFSLAVDVQSSAGTPLEWGRALTAGVRTDTAATLGTGIDTTASVAFGAQAYLHVMGFTGTDATVKIQDSADNVTFADVTGLAFAQVTAAPGAQRIATAPGATIRRYLRAVTVTTGGFTSLAFSVVAIKNEVAVTY